MLEGLTQFERVASESLARSDGVANEGLTEFQNVENEVLTQLVSTAKRSRDPKNIKESGMSTAISNPGHIFALPELPLPENDRLKHRYDPLILQVTNLLMRDGKKGLAQRV